MSTLTRDQKREFKRLGFLVVPDGIDEDVVTAAREQLHDVVPQDPTDYRALVESDERVDDPWEEMDDTDPFAELNRQLFEYAEQLVGEDVLSPPGDRLQLALRYPEGRRPNDPEAEQTSELRSHIDGFGGHYRVGEDIGFFQLFGVVFLDRVDPAGGGFAVWPASHWDAGQFLESHAMESARLGVSGFDADGNWQYDRERSDQFDPVQTFGDPGTVVLAHGKLEHSAGVNLSTRIRMAGIKRFSREDNDEIKADAASNIWKYWPALRDLEVEQFEG